MFPTARQAQDLVASTSTANSYIILALGNIVTALGTGSRSCTLTVSGKSGADVQFLRQFLQWLGYTITQSTTTITIAW